jgi:hypothetical protein
VSASVVGAGVGGNPERGGTFFVVVFMYLPNH